MLLPPLSFFFFFNDTATTEIYTLSLHDALPISLSAAKRRGTPLATAGQGGTAAEAIAFMAGHALANPVLVDVTADDTADILVAAFAAGMHVVLANKRPLTGPKRVFAEIGAAAASHGRQLRFAATVGAGLPI